MFSIRATMPIRMSRPWITLPTDPLKVYFDMCIIKYFLDIISPNNDMLDKMNGIIGIGRHTYNVMALSDYTKQYDIMPLIWRRKRIYLCKSHSVG